MCAKKPLAYLISAGAMGLRPYHRLNAVGLSSAQLAEAIGKLLIQA